MKLLPQKQVLIGPRDARGAPTSHYQVLALEWGCSWQYVWQVEKRALAKLRRALRRAGIESFR